MKGLNEVIVDSDFRDYNRNKPLFRQGWYVGERSHLFLLMKTSQMPQNYYFVTSSLLPVLDRSWLRHRSFPKFSVQLKSPDFSNKKFIPVQTSQKKSLWCHSSVHHALETKCIVFSCAGKCKRLVTIKNLGISRNNRTAGTRANSHTGNIRTKLFIHRH
jgi:hypothetical protein